MVPYLWFLYHIERFKGALNWAAMQVISVWRCKGANPFFWCAIFKRLFFLSKHFFWCATFFLSLFFLSKHLFSLLGTFIILAYCASTFSSYDLFCIKNIGNLLCSLLILCSVMILCFRLFFIFQNIFFYKGHFLYLLIPSVMFPSSKVFQCF